MDDSSHETFAWSDDLISKLIQLRYEKRDEFLLYGKRGSTQDVWMSIIKDLGLEGEVSVLSIRKKWNKLLNKFKDIENKIAIGSCSEDVAWPHYNQMQTIMNELSPHAPSSILTVANNQETDEAKFSERMNNGVCENGEEERSSEEQRPSKRVKRDELDERFIAAVEEGNELLKKINTTLEKQGKEFIHIMSRLVTAMEAQGDDMSM